MNIESLAKQLSLVAKVTKLKGDEYEIDTGAKINGKAVKFYLSSNYSIISFTDKKSTLKQMNQIYELKSPDVTNCIAAVIKLYGFSILSGQLVASLKSESDLISTYYNYIICMGQLINMHAFFDKPE